MALDKYNIVIDGKNYIIPPNGLIRTGYEAMPPRIRTSANPNLGDLNLWEHEGMDSWMGGLGQKKFKDVKMFFDSQGLCTWEDDEVKLANYASKAWDITDLGVTLANMWGGALYINKSVSYNDSIYFGSFYGEWGGQGGRDRLWKFDGTTMVDLSSSLAMTTLSADAADVDTALTVASSAGFNIGDYCLVCSIDKDGWEVVKVTAIPDGTTLNVDRGLPLTWDVGKTYTYPAKAFTKGSTVYEMQYTSMPRLGGGINALCVYGEKLFVGNGDGSMFMYRQDTNQWFVQPYCPLMDGGSPFTDPTLASPWPTFGKSSLDNAMSSMCVWREKLYIGAGRHIVLYDLNTADALNPFGAGPVYRIMDSVSTNNMLVYNFAIYFTVWRHTDRTAGIYKYDGTSVYLIYRFPAPVEIHSMALYDGKLYIGIGKYNRASNKSIGQLWSYDGETMRKVFSRPRNDKHDGKINTVWNLTVIDNYLYFSDHYTTGVYLYDAVHDAVHRAHLRDDAYPGAAYSERVMCLWFWDETIYMAVANKGVWKVSTGDAYSVGGAASQFAGFKYPFFQTSMLGDNFPNMQKLYYRIVFWHSPAVDGQKLHLYLSRNRMTSYSADHTITLVAGATRTSYTFMEEGATTSTGGFSGTQTGTYGIMAYDLSMVLGIQTSAANKQFTLYGFSIEYLPIPESKQRLTLKVMAVDNLELYDGKTYEARRGDEIMRDLSTTWSNKRPVLVEHPYLVQGGTALMYITTWKDVVARPDVATNIRSGDYYNLEGQILVDLVEC